MHHLIDRQVTVRFGAANQTVQVSIDLRSYWQTNAQGTELVLRIRIRLKRLTKCCKKKLVVNRSGRRLT
uniref:Uncharacterized protein n=1 Tax=Arundo donax TaxID=35708 RepID=A0A0A9F9U7_ARUDO